MSAKGGKTPTTKMKEVKSMAKKIGIIVLLCFSLCVGGVSAFANEGHDETDTQTLIETQPPVSSVLFRQDGADIQQSTDEGKTWQSYLAPFNPDFFVSRLTFSVRNVSHIHCNPSRRGDRCQW